MRIGFAFLLVMLMAVGVQAADFSTSYTADNYITSFTIDGNSVPAGVKSSVWSDSQTYTGASLDLATAHTFTWTVKNTDFYGTIEAPAYGTTPANPSAFLGQFSLGGTTYLSGVNTPNVTWSIIEGPLSSYGLNASGNPIWYGSNSSQPISGISTAANWVGLGQFPGSATYTVQAKYTPASPVPLPGAVWLLGSGVAGLLAWRRRKAA